MNLILDIDDFDINNIYYKDTVKNNIISNSKFIKTVYSNNIFTLNTIYIKVPIRIINYEKQYNKYKCYIDIYSNKSYINKLFYIEKEIINKINIKKPKIYDIYKQITSKTIYLFINKKLNNDNTKLNNDNTKLNNNNTKLNNNNTKLNNDNTELNNKIICMDDIIINDYINVKISGVWETDNNCGLTFKFII